jgi:hypothetical protein
MSESSDAGIPSDDAYETFGYFDPFQAARFLKRFEQEGVRFQLSDASGVERWDDIFPQYVLRTAGSTRAQRNDRIEIFVYFEDKERARRIIEET